MSGEVLALIATVVFGTAGVVAAYYGYRSFRASQEQLELAREQTAQVPRIELMEVAFRTLREDPELLREVRDAQREMEELRHKRAEEERQRQERERARRERERREREERERRERRRSGFDASTVDEMGETGPTDWLRWLLDPPEMSTIANLSESLPMPTPNLTPPKYVYEGPVPDHFVDVGIRNVGQAAAYDVTGWLWFDKAVFEPVDNFASSDVKVVGEADGKVKVELSVGNEGGRLFPSYNDPYTFRIPVRLRKVVDTSFEFEFTSPQGNPAHGTFSLHSASGSQGANG